MPPPADPSDRRTDPLSKTPPRLRYIAKAARPLDHWLTSYWARSGTRLSEYAACTVPSVAPKLALLLLACGYEARVRGALVELRTGRWRRALMPRGESLAAYLRRQLDLAKPQRTMNPNDDRLETVFRSGAA